MSSVIIEKTLPADPVEARAVLHIRRLLKKELSASADLGARARALAMLFESDDPDGIGFIHALQSPHPILEAARIVAGGRTKVALGHDSKYVERCRKWLLKRKQAAESPGSALHQIIAYDLETLLAVSEGMELAQSNLALVLQGETGTGKEIHARAIHELGNKTHTGNFVAVQVAGMPTELINDELFGHEKGAFTGAIGQRDGRLEEADLGTLLIDEVGDLPPEAQVRLLRFLQDGELSRLGTNKRLRVQTRIIAASWRDIPMLVKSGSFRQDLYQRFAGAEIQLPPLRARGDTIIEVARELIRRQCEITKTICPQVTESAMDALARYTWPGNLRELDLTIKLILATYAGRVIDLEDLPSKIYANYLNIPLWERAPAFLRDEPEGGGRLAPTHLVARIEVVHESLYAMPLEDPSDELVSAFRTFQDAVSASSDATVEMTHRLDALAEAQRTLVADSIMANILIELESLELAEDLKMVVVKHLQKVTNGIAASRKTIAKIDRATLMNQDPWWRLATEIKQQPLARTLSFADIAGLLGLVVPIIKTIAPELSKELEVLVVEKGLKAVVARARTWLATASSETNSDDDVIDIEDDFSEVEYRLWDMAQWGDFFASHINRSQGAKALRIDPKTLKAHLKKKGIGESWGRDG